MQKDREDWLTTMIGRSAAFWNAGLDRLGSSTRLLPLKPQIYECTNTNAINAAVYETFSFDALTISRNSSEFVISPLIPAKTLALRMRVATWPR